MGSNFPTIYCASLKESKDRQDNIKRQFLENNIQSFQFLLSDRFENTNDMIEGSRVFYLDDGTKGAITSHLKMIKNWYYNTNETYGFFCEDDLSLETVQYWNFTWEEFTHKLPENWDCIQMQCVGTHLDQIEFRRRYWDDFSVGAYILTRKYAKMILDSFLSEKTFYLQFPEKINWVPLAEHIIYYSPNSVIDSNQIEYNVYTFPLFVEDINFNSTFFNQKSKNMGEDSGIYQWKHKEHHIESHHKVLNWWENIGKNLSLDEILNK